MVIALPCAFMTLPVWVVLGHSGGSSAPSRPDTQVTTSVAPPASPAFKVSSTCRTAALPTTSEYILFGVGVDADGHADGHFGLLQFNVTAGRIDGTYTEVQFSVYGTPGAPRSPGCTGETITGQVENTTHEVSLRVGTSDLRGTLSRDRLEPDSAFRDSLSPVATSTWRQVTEDRFNEAVRKWATELPLKPCSTNQATACDH
jgi:hypothetical protein